MDVLVIGSGGREHALAWKLAQSARVDRVDVAPGNGGTDRQISESANQQIIKSADQPIGKSANSQSGERTNQRIGNSADQEVEYALRTTLYDLVVVGPEAPLADGLADRLTAAGLRCFGPTQAAARLEASKAFAKTFMARYGIPTARCAIFQDHAQALRHLREVAYPVVIKASGLAAGKGVIVPDTPAEAEAALRQIMIERAFGSAGDDLLIEERLSGPEASVLAFCDGQTVVSMPVAQDHKRVFDGDRGPNTGGMGAYAPAPVITPALMDEITRTILSPTVAGLLAEGIRYVGVLYAGLMLTAGGPRLLEYNCRFGDPETQAILPLLESDLTEIMLACVEGSLDKIVVRWRPGAAATVVAASAGYPGVYPKGCVITGIEQAEALPGVTVFHAGTRRAEDGRLLTDGGRVLAVTGVGPDLRQALGRAYAGMSRIHFDGMRYRRDIGAQASN